MLKHNLLACSAACLSSRVTLWARPVIQAQCKGRLPWVSASVALAPLQTENYTNTNQCNFNSSLNQELHVHTHIQIKL
jgi:hypothetical protein